MLLGEKRGRLNLAEFRYAWVLARAALIEHRRVSDKGREGTQTKVLQGREGVTYIGNDD
jgi:hypothetical protein